jgi:5'-3' exonuclease
VIPVIVFDGGKLKMKKGVEKDRDANREENRKKAQECLE